MEINKLKVTGWTNYDDERYENIRDNISDYKEVKELKKIVADDIKEKGYKFSGFNHQYHSHGTPILNEKYKFTCSMREWGDIMAIAYNPKYNEDDMAYVLWAWNPPVIDIEGNCEKEVYPDNFDYTGADEKERILVVVDMQNDFVDGSLGTKEAQAIIENVVREIADERYTKIYVTKDTHFNDYLSTNEGKKLPVEHCIRLSHGWQINDKVAEALEKRADITKEFEKYTFGSTELADAINKIKNRVESVTLIGLCTDICVVSNALLVKALNLNGEVIVKADCCAGVTPELHQNALNVMKSCQIEVC